MKIKTLIKVHKLVYLTLLLILTFLINGCTMIESWFGYNPKINKQEESNTVKKNTNTTKNISTPMPCLILFATFRSLELANKSYFILKRYYPDQQLMIREKAPHDHEPPLYQLILGPVTSKAQLDEIYSRIPPWFPYNPIQIPFNE